MKRGQVILGLVSVVAFGLVATGIFYYRQYTELLKNPKLVSEKETQVIIDRLEHFITLPKDESPIVATITDVEKLKDQPFFSNAQLGDKVLLYPKSKKALLYRPKTKMIVEFSSLYIADQNIEGNN